MTDEKLTPAGAGLVGPIRNGDTVTFDQTVLVDGDHVYDRVADDNGDELEHGEPDYPGQDEQIVSVERAREMAELPPLPEWRIVSPRVLYQHLLRSPAEPVRLRIIVDEQIVGEYVSQAEKDLEWRHDWRIKSAMMLAPFEAARNKVVADEPFETLRTYPPGTVLPGEERPLWKRLLGWD